MNFLPQLRNLHKSWNTFKKNAPPTLFDSEIIDCKKWSNLNAQKALCRNTYGQSTK